MTKDDPEHRRRVEECTRQLKQATRIAELRHALGVEMRPEVKREYDKIMEAVKRAELRAAANPDPRDIQLDNEMTWIKAENDVIDREIAALSTLEGDAWLRSHASVTRRLVALKAAIARHRAATDCDTEHG